MKKANIAVLVSGGGTNLQALLDAQSAGKLPHGEIALVVSSNPGAYALERAAKARRSGLHRFPRKPAAVRKPLRSGSPKSWPRIRSTLSFWRASSPSSARRLPRSGRNGF